MQPDYLIDTNILVYHSHGEHKCTSFIQTLTKNRRLFISIITKIEFLGWHDHQKDLLPLWNRLIDAALVLPLDDRIADAAVALRQHRRIRLGDAVIAATALEHKLVLATRNGGDFRHVEGLKLFDPAGH